MMEEYVLDIGNTSHIECLRFFFSELIRFDLDVSRKELNEHRMRKQSCKNIPSCKNRGVLLISGMIFLCKKQETKVPLYNSTRVHASDHTSEKIVASSLKISNSGVIYNGVSGQVLFP